MTVLEVYGTRQGADARGGRDGRISRRRAMQDHSMSAEELDAWMADFDRHGVPGLRTTKLQYLSRRRVWQ